MPVSNATPESYVAMRLGRCAYYMQLGRFAPALACLHEAILLAPCIDDAAVGERAMELATALGLVGELLEARSARR